MNTGKMLTGGCLCEGVRYRVTGEMSDIGLCHCSQCTRTSGHIFASADCAADALTFDESRTLRWYRSSEKAERGFCSNCGGKSLLAQDQRRRDFGDGRNARSSDRPAREASYLLRFALGLRRDPRPAPQYAGRGRSGLIGLGRHSQFPIPSLHPKERA
ncbi:MAG: GFA family protein [Acidobacteriaceae bacterium]|nr:GFA family protein [Acidobacteriaceae bacterium]